MGLSVSFYQTACRSSSLLLSLFALLSRKILHPFSSFCHCPHCLSYSQPVSHCDSTNSLPNDRDHWQNSTFSVAPSLTKHTPAASYSNISLLMLSGRLHSPSTVGAERILLLGEWPSRGQIQCVKGHTLKSNPFYSLQPF